jgi:hypothetical protein
MGYKPAAGNTSVHLGPISAHVSRNTQKSQYSHSALFKKLRPPVLFLHEKEQRSTRDE